MNTVAFKSNTVPTWHVEYKYDGGSGTVRVQAVDSDSAAAMGMPLAAPKAASDPTAKCHLTRVYRIMRHDELSSLPHRGLETAIDFSHDRKDGGHPYLVIGRGHIRDSDGYDIWTTVGRIVSTVHTQTAGQSLIKSLHRNDMTSAMPAIYDVVPRDAVRVVTDEADAPFYPAWRVR